MSNHIEFSVFPIQMGDKVVSVRLSVPRLGLDEAIFSISPTECAANLRRVFSAIMSPSKAPEIENDSGIKKRIYRFDGAIPCEIHTRIRVQGQSQSILRL